MKKKEKLVPVSFKFTAKDKAYLTALCTALEASQVSVIRLAIRRLAREEKIPWLNRMAKEIENSI